jgi:hypothetical protein
VVLLQYRRTTQMGNFDSSPISFIRFNEIIRQIIETVGPKEHTITPAVWWMLARNITGIKILIFDRIFFVRIIHFLFCK